MTLQSPHSGPYWPGPGLEEAVTLSRLCHLLAAQSAWDAICKTRFHTRHHMDSLRSLGASCVWHPAPSAMTAEQGLRTQR